MRPASNREKLAMMTGADGRSECVCGSPNGVYDPLRCSTNCVNWADRGPHTAVMITERAIAKLALNAMRKAELPKFMENFW